MIAIPNMSKPKNCRTCKFKSNKEGECWFVHYDSNCPLIEIIRCGECKYYEESEYIRGDMVCKYHMGHTYYTEADRFCSHGERK